MIYPTASCEVSNYFPSLGEGMKGRVKNGAKRLLLTLPTGQAGSPLKVEEF